MTPSRLASTQGRPIYGDYSLVEVNTHVRKCAELQSAMAVRQVSQKKR